MNQLKRLFERLTWTQRIWIAVAVAAVVGGIATVVHWNQERDFKPLFTSLAAEDAGALTTKLREGGIDYRLGDNGASVLVPSDLVAEARLQMASAGLPKSGRIGFELFDKANFGASEFTEQVNYHRAIEGELERSVMSIREVEQARVHVTMAKESVYSEARQPAKASVLVKLRTSAALSPQNVAAICQLTASGVPGLSADQVSLVDTNGNLLNRPHAVPLGGDEGASGEGALDYRKGVEHDLQTKMAATLEPLLGADHFRAGASAEVDFSSGEQSEETFDPEKSALVTSQRTSDGPALATASGVPGTASNLPRPVSRPSTGSSSYSRTTESNSYQTSRLVKHTRLPQGTVKRLSLSVLVDHSLRWEGSGDKARRIVEPPSAEKLKVIRDLVTAATGLNSERGDQLAVEAFPFESTLTAEPLALSAAVAANPSSPVALPAWLQKLMAQKRFPIIAAVGGGALLVLIAGGVVLMRRSSKRKKKLAAEALAAIAAAKPKEQSPSTEEAERQVEARMAEQHVLVEAQEAAALMALKLPAVSTKKTGVISRHIAAETKKDPTAMAHVVRSWLNSETRP